MTSIIEPDVDAIVEIKTAIYEPESKASTTATKQGGSGGEQEDRDGAKETG